MVDSKENYKFDLCVKGLIGCFGFGFENIITCKVLQIVK